MTELNDDVFKVIKEFLLFKKDERLTPPHFFIINRFFKTLRVSQKHFKMGLPIRRYGRYELVEYVRLYNWGEFYDYIKEEIWDGYDYIGYEKKS